MSWAIFVRCGPLPPGPGPAALCASRNTGRRLKVGNDRISPNQQRAASAYDSVR